MAEIQACDFRLQAGLEAPCDGMSTQGIQNKAIVVNFDDVDWDVVRAARTGNTFAQFKLKNGKQGYAAYVPGKTPFTGTNKALAVGTYLNKFTKQVKLVILKNGAAVTVNIIDKLANGRFVVIVENTYQGKDGDNTFELYGAELGLGATEMTDDKYSEETDGGWAVTLEETNALSSGIFLANEDGGGRAIFESLLTPATT